jgi:RNA polymerase sigma-70 factor (ECF subfamily)
VVGEPTSTAESAATADLVRKAQGGDRAAFAELHRAFARVVHGIALAHGPASAAEDVTQDVFMTAYQRLPELRDAAAFGGWLCATARNAATSELRRRRRAGASVLVEVVDRGAAPDAAAQAADTRARVLACIGELPEAYRETLLLRLCEGLAGPEIAARTGMTHGSVRVNLTRGMALLRPLLQERGLP